MDTKALAEKIKAVVLIDRYGHIETIEDVEIAEYGHGRIRVRMTQQYHRWTLTIEHLDAIAELLGTDRINIGEPDEIEVTGCESCDWGSEYGHSIYVSGIKDEE